MVFHGSMFFRLLHFWNKSASLFVLSFFLIEMFVSCFSSFFVISSSWILAEVSLVGHCGDFRADLWSLVLDKNTNLTPSGRDSQKKLACPPPKLDTIQQTPDTVQTPQHQNWTPLRHHSTKTGHHPATSCTNTSRGQNIYTYIITPR